MEQVRMRGWITGTLAALAVMAAPASAQSGDAHVGTWAFQTEPYGNEQFSVIMSGVAIVSPPRRGRYDIRLVANELIVAVNGQSQMLTARQTCTGESSGGQFNISCQLAEPLEGYQPDNFVLQAGERDQMVGVLSSATSSQVTFTRVR
jgi:hypothetical protein